MEANGEGNRDGSAQNLSWNCGVEGGTDDPAIETKNHPNVGRERFFTSLLSSAAR